MHNPLIPNYLEKVQSQLPALQLLIELGWTYLTPDECNNLRSHRLGSSILESVLLDHLRGNEKYEFKGNVHPFTENALVNAIQRLKAFRATGAIHQNEQAYDLLCLGTSIPQTVDGDTKSFTVNFIDWKNPQNNTYHCSAEYKVERVGLQKHYIPDIVLFVNGIPISIIECKRSAYEDPKKKPIEMAISQLVEYQSKGGIPQAFLYSQLLLALARDKAEYGTSGTSRKFWSHWREEDIDEEIKQLIYRPIPKNATLLEGPFANVKKDFIGLHNQNREVYEQDRLLYSICRPERLLDLMYKFIVFDNGIKKIARYQQFFTIKDILHRVQLGEDNSARRGGVVWHTTGSGKSLTMVMLAKSLSLAKGILNPKVILVTDRVDLDDQIYGTFRACGLEPEQATTGRNLVEHLLDEKSHIVTTTIHKFDTAASDRRIKRISRNTFVLVDEGHRSQNSEQHALMKMTLKGACFIAFTGTPLAKSVKKNTFLQFGELFQPPYTIGKAIKDKAVVELLYEARHVPQPVDETAIDGWFKRLTLNLNDDQKADLKRKFASAQQLNKAKEKIKMVAWDITMHYSRSFQGTGLKGQLVAPDKATALLYKQCLDEFGKVSSEVLISAPDVGEGDNKSGPSDEEKVFWDQMMSRYGSETKYNKLLINAFKHTDEPEIIIVVDKLLTGFDAPPNTVLYLTRHLKNHTLLQAISRVNRIYAGKEHGLVMDYSGVLENLDETIDFYDQLANYDEADLENTITNVNDKVKQLPQLHSDLWELFTAVRGESDPEIYEQSLREKEHRDKFYERFIAFARNLSIALGSTNFLENTDTQTVSIYKRDLKFFQNLRAAVSLRFQERVDYSEYEPQIKKLLDSHLGAGEIEPLCDPINLFNQEEREKVLGDDKVTLESQADTIASATQRVIELEMEKDRPFYTKFSKLIEEVLDDLYAKRISALEALGKLRDISDNVVSHTDDDMPESLIGHDLAKRYYGSIQEDLEDYTAGRTEPATDTALAIEERTPQYKIRDWRDNQDAINQIRGEIDDIIFEIRNRYTIDLPLEAQDKVIDKCVEIAIANDD